MFEQFKSIFAVTLLLGFGLIDLIIFGFLGTTIGWRALAIGIPLGLAELTLGALTMRPAVRAIMPPYAAALRTQSPLAVVRRQAQFAGILALAVAALHAAIFVGLGMTSSHQGGIWMGWAVVVSDAVVGLAFLSGSSLFGVLRERSARPLVSSQDLQARVEALERDVERLKAARGTQEQ